MYSPVVSYIVGSAHLEREKGRERKQGTYSLGFDMFLPKEDEVAVLGSESEAASHRAAPALIIWAPVGLRFSWPPFRSQVCVTHAPSLLTALQTYCCASHPRPLPQVLLAPTLSTALGQHQSVLFGFFLHLQPTLSQTQFPLSSFSINCSCPELRH